MIKNYYTYIKEEWEIWDDDCLEEDKIDNEDGYDFITDKKFRQFLIDNKCLHEYLHNCHNKDYSEDYNGAYLTDDPKTYIVDAFYWGDVPEGYDYWSDLNGEWLNYINN